MRRYLPLILLCLAACETPTQPKLGRAHVQVPRIFAATSGWIDGAPSDCERYLSMYRQGYWECVRKYTENIDYQPAPSDYIASGWGSEVTGFSDGYGAANEDIQKDLRRFGKERTAVYLKEVENGGGF